MIDFAEQPSGNHKLKFIPDENAPKPYDYTSVQQVASKCAEAKNKWLSACARKLMPDFVIGWAESGDPKLREKAKRWIDKKQFVLQEHPDGRCRFLQGGKLLSEFKTVIKDGKVTFETKDYA